MAKYWVDPPSGWRFGFPKVWDDELHPDPYAWLYENGYPISQQIEYTRMWEWKEGDSDD